MHEMKVIKIQIWDKFDYSEQLRGGISIMFRVNLFTICGVISFHSILGFSATQSGDYRNPVRRPSVGSLIPNMFVYTLALHNSFKNLSERDRDIFTDTAIFCILEVNFQVTAMENVTLEAIVVCIT